MKKLDIQMVVNDPVTPRSSTTVSTAAATAVASSSSFSLPSILKSSTAWHRPNEQICSLVQNIPKPPLGFDFSKHQRQQQIHFFKLLQDRIVPPNNVDVYNADIITVCKYFINL
jgi:hypothetical protein